MSTDRYFNMPDKPGFRLPQTRGKRKKTDATNSEQAREQQLRDRAHAKRIAKSIVEREAQQAADDEISALLRSHRDEVMNR